MISSFEEKSSGSVTINPEEHLNCSVSLNAIQAPYGTATEDGNRVLFTRGPKIADKILAPQITGTWAQPNV